MKWSEQGTARLGDMGEQMVARRMHDRGYQGWRSIEEEEAHPFDFIWHKRNTFENKIVEVKTKPKRRIYNDTGFDVKNYFIYSGVDPITPVEVLFVDVSKGEIYGNTLKKLMEPYTDAASGIDYPLVQGEQVYFCMDYMVLFDKLTIDEIKSLKVK